MSGRLVGKSLSMIMTASKNGAVVFCATKEGEQRILEKADRLGVTVKTMVNNR